MLTAASSIPLVGVVQAGFPSPATEALSDTITLHEYLVEHPSTTSFYDVPDDAMGRIGIFKGDVAIIESKPAGIGDYVVAEIDGEILLRQLREDQFGIFMEPANMDYDCIFECGEMRVLGVVVGIVRKC